jgi:regulator of PEP synthase PpsR (kinase-PPPase family)
MNMNVDEAYYRRVEAMEFAVVHDDGQRPEDLINADVVLVGVSRSSKTPLSIYLGYRGIRTANVPLALGTEPPAQLFDVDPRRMFGLVTTPEVLMKVRTARMKELGTIVPGYADREHIERELEDARAIMKQLGCVIINTANRAIEEIAQEVLRYVGESEVSFGQDREISLP